MEIFTEITHTNNTKSLRVNDWFLVRVWEIECERWSRKMNAEAIRALLSVSVGTKLTGISSTAANLLSDAYDLGHDGAAIFPDEFQPWESDMLSLCDRDLDLFSLTFDGEVMKGKVLKILHDKYELELGDIGSNKYIHPLEV